MPTKKSVAAEVAKRCETVLSLMVMGLTRKEICQYASEKADPPWGVSDRQVDRYIAEAKESIKKASAIKAEHELGIAILRLEDLYKRSIAIQDYKAALAVQKERHELLSLKKGNAPDRDTGNIDELIAALRGSREEHGMG